MAENFTRKIGNAKASIRATLGSAIILREAIYETCYLGSLVELYPLDKNLGKSGLTKKCHASQQNSVTIFTTFLFLYQNQ